MVAMVLHAANEVSVHNSKSSSNVGVSSDTERREKSELHALFRRFRRVAKYSENFRARFSDELELIRRESCDTCPDGIMTKPTVNKYWPVR